MSIIVRNTYRFGIRSDGYFRFSPFTRACRVVSERTRQAIRTGVVSFFVVGLRCLLIVSPERGCLDPPRLARTNAVFQDPECRSWWMETAAVTLDNGANRAGECRASQQPFLAGGRPV